MTADYCGVQIETIVVDETMANDKDFKAKKGQGSFPMAELPDGTILFESTAIAAHIARQAGRTDFIGGTAFEAAQISEVVDYTCSTVTSKVGIAAYSTFGMLNDKAALAKAV